MHKSGMLNPQNDSVLMPAMQLPAFRTSVAIQNGTERNLLFRTWGGLGDQICAEPTLRYAIKAFEKTCTVSLASEHPELFTHLKFDTVFNIRSPRKSPNFDKYFLFNTIVPPSDLLWQFACHMLVHCVDFPSICALRCQLPVADREIVLHPNRPMNPVFVPDNAVFVHAGRHWPSKTFPKDFWDKVLFELVVGGVTPVLVGANTDENRGTVDVEINGCLDYRNRLSINDSIYYLKNAKVLLTNDSSPLHMAASGGAWIGFVATCKHPDFITHWRNGEWSWRMKNFGRGGIWDLIDYCPNKKSEVTAEFVEESQLRAWLPDPKEFAQWAIEKVLN